MYVMQCHANYVIANYFADMYAIANYVTSNYVIANNYDCIIHVTKNNVADFFVRELCKMMNFFFFAPLNFEATLLATLSLFCTFYKKIKKGLHTCKLA